MKTRSRALFARMIHPAGMSLTMAILLSASGCVSQQEVARQQSESRAKEKAEQQRQIAAITELRDRGTITDQQAFDMLAVLQGGQLPRRPATPPRPATPQPAPLAPVAAAAAPEAVTAAETVAESAPAPDARYRPQRVLKDQRLRSVGSDSMDEIVAEMEKVFATYHQNLVIRHEGLGSSTAMPALIEGRSDFGPMSRLPQPAEIARFKERFNYEPTVVCVAIDALGVYVHPDNPIAAQGLTLAQLDAIYSATRKRGGEELTTWGQLGLTGEWAHAPIVRYGRNKASGTYGFFREQVLKKGDFNPTVNELAGSADVVSSVAADRFGIGYSGIGYKNDRVKTVALAQNTGDKPVVPKETTALDGSYALARGLYVIVNRNPAEPLSDKQREFLTFALSDVGQDIVKKIGYYPMRGEALLKEQLRLK